MINIRNYFAIAAVVLIVACGGNPEPSQAKDVPAAAATPQATRDLAPIEESAADTNGSQPDSEEKIVLAQTSAGKPSGAPPQTYKEGKHYTVLTTAQGTSSSPDVVEVAEIFWYGCPHCYNFDPYVSKWKKELPDGVKLVQVPVMWNPTNEIHARMFYTADALGKLDEMHEAIFKEMHLNKKMLTNESAIEDFFARFGVSSDDFRKTFRSFPVETKLKKAKNLTQRYRVQSVPLLVVNGKYVVTGPEIKNFEDMIAVGNELIEREQANL